MNLAVRWISRVALVLAATAAALGCARPEPATAMDLRNRASFELGCPASALELVRIDDATGGVVGCGRRVVYVEKCEDRCRWAFDRESPPPAWGGWSLAVPGAANGPFRTTTLRSSPERESEWRARVPGLLEDEPGF